MENLEDMTPLRDDILIVRMPKNKVENGGESSFGYIFLGDKENKDDIQYFEIVQVGHKVKELEKGEVVAVPWTRVTPPQNGIFRGKEREFGVTSESEVLAVIEL